MAPALIGLDWGTSALRAYLVGRDGSILERRESGHGIRALPEGGLPAAFAAASAGWPGDVPVLMSGMVGSRSGWVEAPYLDVAGRGVGLAEVAEALLDVSEAVGRTAFLVPGLKSHDPADVMRGEETQVMGLGLRDGTALLPGTHSKWVRIAGGRIVSFRTAMTGEVFAALSRHTILADTIAEPGDEAEAQAGFDAGLEAARALDRPGALLNRLFAIRASVLLGDMPAGRSPEYLSGLLVGAEVAAEGTDAPVTVVASPALTSRYTRALDAFGVPHEAAPPDIAARGLHAIGVAARLITGHTT
ncbi:2-dehydro-3-deoxygalactonokinase [Lutibaculum baratangense]|uniref:2-dehydro-3-deoxygalactonokinase n=1 Tax=Lutibaculum baratangense AMV1 TaxID=631454 RepID=V4RFI2_9HYPH|nr:2-dehydro-3-deoxygalactonokinase [Lutibaculum baratangense]ESR24144.1 2-dehydro-3-deoxygalactonokinase [Lutibaculum baratangense AMV1]